MSRCAVFVSVLHIFQKAAHILIDLSEFSLFYDADLVSCNSSLDIEKTIFLEEFFLNKKKQVIYCFKSAYRHLIDYVN